MAYKKFAVSPGFQEGGSIFNERKVAKGPAVISDFLKKPPFLGCALTSTQDLYKRWLYL
jgi:hypothetical protein